MLLNKAYQKKPKWSDGMHVCDQHKYICRQIIKNEKSERQICSSTLTLNAKMKKEKKKQIYVIENTDWNSFYIWKYLYMHGYVCVRLFVAQRQSKKNLIWGLNVKISNSNFNKNNWRCVVLVVVVIVVVVVFVVAVRSPSLYVRKSKKIKTRDTRWRRNCVSRLHLFLKLKHKFL